MSAIAIIPARGGSHRIPRKNIRLFHGKPIIAYSIAKAFSSRVFDIVAVSTEDEEIAEVASGYGVTILWRPRSWARDDIGTQAVMRYHMMVWDCFDVACCLYPCVPLLDPRSIARAVELLEGFDYVVPVGEWLGDPGQFYVGKAEAFSAGRPLLGCNTRLLPIDRSRALDINTVDDWRKAEQIYAALHGIEVAA